MREAAPAEADAPQMLQPRYRKPRPVDPTEALAVPQRFGNFEAIASSSSQVSAAEWPQPSRGGRSSRRGQW